MLPRTNHLLTALTLCISLSLGCGGVVYEGYDEDGERTANIVNGQNDHGHPAVGVLYLKGQAGCTATLIGTRTVLTAAHCVTDSKSVPYQLFANIGFALQPGGQVHNAAAVMVHQAYGSQNADVAVVRLSQPITSVTPMFIATKAPQMGETITLVGFGITADGVSSSFGTKRRATNTIGKLTTTEMIFYGAQGNVGNICNGDSGGPAFATREGREYLVGVHSWGEGQCGVAEHDQRVDAYRSWIEQQAGNDLHKAPQPSTPTPAAPGPSPTPPVPKVSFTSPGANAQVGQTFSVTVQASCSDGIARVDLYVDGVKVQQKGAAPFTFQVSGLAAGHHNLRAEAVSNGQLKASALISVAVQASQQPAPPAPAPGAQPDPQTPTMPPHAPNAPNASADELSVVGACSLSGERTAPPASLLLVALIWVLRRRRR
jgi:V8-like Glu-specific endopeptidase